MGLHKNRTPTEIVKLVEKGKRLTVSQYAQRFDTSKNHITNILTKLRKRGYPYHPVDFTHEKEGVIVDVTKKEKDFLSTNVRYKKQIMSRVENNFRAMEIAWQEHPQLRGEIEEQLNETLVKMLSQSKELKALKKINPA